MGQRREESGMQVLIEGGTQLAVTGVPEGNEKGVYLALDLGGTNL